MKVLLITDAPLAAPLAGDQLVTAQLLQALTRRADVEVLTLRPGGWDPAMASGARLLEEPNLGGGAPPQRLARLRALVGSKSLLEQRLSDLSLPRLRELLSRSHADVVFFNHLRVAALLPQLEVSTGMRTVYVAHNAEYEAYASTVQIETNPLLKFALAREGQKTIRLERRVVEAADLTIALTAEDARRLKELSPSAGVQVVPPAVPRHVAAHEAPLDARRVLLVGSYLWHAKFLNALWLVREVWPAVLDRFPSARLEIVGKGATRLLPYVRATDSIRVSADVPDIGPFLRDASIFVNPERQRGGIKLKTLDAASFGLPIVSTVAGVEGTGLRAEQSCIVANDAAGFARGILRLIVDPVFGRSLGVAAQRVMQHEFSDDALQDRVDRVLDGLRRAA